MYYKERDHVVMSPFSKCLALTLTMEILKEVFEDSRYT